MIEGAISEVAAQGARAAGAIALIAAALTALAIFGIPWLWHLLKPWLHSITG